MHARNPPAKVRVNNPPAKGKGDAALAAAHTHRTPRHIALSISPLPISSQVFNNPENLILTLTLSLT